jgi:hypothetical protein
MKTRNGVSARIALLCAAAVMASSQTVAGQEAQTTAEEEAGGRGFFQVGYLRMDVDDLNGSLAGAGLPSLDRNYLTLGGGGYGSRGRFLIGGEGHALLGRKETTTGGARQLTADGGYGLFRVGYLAVSAGPLDVYPLFGIGGGGTSLKIAERSVPTFDEVLTDPERSATMSAAVFLLDLAAAVSYRVTMGEREGRVGGILLGIQAGYTFAPAQSAWTLDGINDVADGPDFGIEGPYVRIAIGGWGRNRAQPR